MNKGKFLEGNWRIIESVDEENRSWYYVQKRFLRIFWLICVNREGYPSLESARHGTRNYFLQNPVEYVSYVNLLERSLS